MTNIITTTAQLDEVCKHIDEAGRFAVDMEFIPERTYEAELCLVQVATDDEAWVIDPLGQADMYPIWERIANPDILKVVHAGDQDLDLAYMGSNLIPQNVFDTQIAAGFLGFGYPIGYSKLLTGILGKSVAKTESYTDWRRRPLTDSQIQYAIDDVKHLLSMYDKLAKNLSKINRLEWVQEECRKYCDISYYEKDTSRDFLRIKGANALDRRGLGILRELTNWRHAEASRSNRPLRSILADGVLLEVARRPPQQISDIERVRGIRPDQLRSYGNSLLQVVKEGLSLAQSDLPHWPESRIPSRREIMICDVLFTVLKLLAYDLDIAAELVATRSIIEGLVRRHAENRMEGSTLPLLNGWRWEFAGQHLVEVLKGSVLTLQIVPGNEPIMMKLTAPD